MSGVRAALTVGTFAVGLGIGAVAQVVTAPPPPVNPYRALPTTSEPPAAAAVVRAIKNDDARALARMIEDPDMLKALGQAIQPIVDVSDVKFVGAVDRDGRILSAYTVTGRDQTGNKLILGFVLQVQNDEVVGVN